MKLNTINILLFCIGLTLAISCSKKEENESGQLTQEEIQEQLTISSLAYENNMDMLRATEGGSIELVIPGLFLPISSTLPDNFLPDLFSTPSKSSKLSLKNSFDFNYYVGTWEYVSFMQWNRTNSPSDKIIFKFRSSESSSTNDATLTIYDYTSTSVNSSNRTTGLKAKIEINNVTIWSNEYVATYPALGKVNVSTTKKINDYTIKNTTQAIRSDTAILISSTTEKMKGNDTFYKAVSNTKANLTFSPNSNLIETVVYTNGLEFRLNLMFTDDDVNNNEVIWNNIFSMGIYKASNKLVDLKYEKHSGEWNLWIYFTNGEKVEAYNYLNELASTLEELNRALFTYPSDNL